MPSYLGGSVRLATSDLDPTLSATPVAQAGGKQATQLRAIAEHLQQNSKTLTEFPQTDHDGHLLSMIGPAQDMPFFLVQCRGSSGQAPDGNRRELGESQEKSNGTIPQGHDTTGVSEQTQSLTGKQLPAQGLNGDSDHTNKRALAVHLHLSPHNFLKLPQCLQTDTKSASTRLDVKIDIYVNGDLANSTYTTPRLPEYNPVSGIDLMLSGHRVGRLAEEPWIFAGTPVDQHSKENSAEAQWSRMNSALKYHAQDSSNKQSGVLGELHTYLQAVATMEMPEALRHGLNAKIGIIDVVLTAGRGQKWHASANYLTKPTPMELSSLFANKSYRRTANSLATKSKPAQVFSSAGVDTRLSTARRRIITPSIKKSPTKLYKRIILSKPKSVAGDEHRSPNSASTSTPLTTYRPARKTSKVVSKEDDAVKKLFVTPAAGVTNARKTVRKLLSMPVAPTHLAVTPSKLPILPRPTHHPTASKLTVPHQNKDMLASDRCTQGNVALPAFDASIHVEAVPPTVEGSAVEQQKNGTMAGEATESKGLTKQESESVLTRLTGARRQIRSERGGYFEELGILYGVRFIVC